MMVQKMVSQLFCFLFLTNYVLCSEEKKSLIPIHGGHTNYCPTQNHHFPKEGNKGTYFTSDNCLAVIDSYDGEWLGHSIIARIRYAEPHLIYPTHFTCAQQSIARMFQSGECVSYYFYNKPKNDKNMHKMVPGSKHSYTVNDREIDLHGYFLAHEAKRKWNQSRMNQETGDVISNQTRTIGTIALLFGRQLCVGWCGDTQLVIGNTASKKMVYKTTPTAINLRPTTESEISPQLVGYHEIKTRLHAIVPNFETIALHRDDFIILGTQSFWHYMPEKEVVATITDQLQQGKTPDDICKDLIEKAEKVQQSNRTDTITGPEDSNVGHIKIALLVPNIPPSFWDNHKSSFIGGGALLLLFGILFASAHFFSHATI